MRVGLNLPQYEIDFEGGCDPRALARIARRAEELGFDDLWLSDHPFAIGPDGSASGALEPLTTLGYLAAATDRIGLGTLVLAASMRSPIEVAAAVASLPRERVTIGIGAGWYRPEHDAFGVDLPPFGARLARLEEHLRAIHGKARVIVGGSSTKVRALADRYADGWNAAWDVPVEWFRLHAGPTASVGVTVLLGDDHQLERAVERMRARAPFMRDLSRDSLRASIIVGDADACAGRIAAYDCEEVIVTLAARDDEEMVERFGSAVLPRLHDV